MKFLIPDSIYDAELKIMKAPSKYDADAVVQIANNVVDEETADDDKKDLIWYFVSSEYDDHDKKVIFVSSKYDADLTIYLASGPWDVEWVNKEKKALLAKK